MLMMRGRAYGRMRRRAATRGGAHFLRNETSGLAIDYLHPIAGERVARKTAAGVVNLYSLQEFYTNATTASPKLTYDIAGNKVWSPHNLFLNSNAPATQSVATLVGHQYTVSVRGSGGTLTGSSGASGVATAGNPLTFIATGTTSTFTRAGLLTRMQMNRGDKVVEYLATTSAIRIGVAVDYHPTTHAPLGMIGEAVATNLLLNSEVLVTQSCTVAAVAHTLSFWGTGTVTLSGTSTGAKVGTGATVRSSFAFTPTAGTLTLTVTGSVVDAQLEANPVATSLIPTKGATVTRAVDLITVSTSAEWWNASGANSVVMWAAALNIATNTSYMSLHGGTDAERIIFDTSSGTRQGRVLVHDNNVLQATLSPAAGTPVAGTTYKLAAAIAAADFALSVGGAAVLTTASGTLPTANTMNVCGPITGGRNIYFKKHKIVPRRMTNAELVSEAT
jgi:hypothetical protein